MDANETSVVSTTEDRQNYIRRLLATASAFTFFGIGGVLIPIVATPLLYLCYRSKTERQRRARWLINRVFLLFIHYMRVVGILEWRFEDLEKLQRKGLLILANHPTLLDVVFLVALVPGANCIVKGELLRNPAMRGFVSMTGFIVNDSGAGLVNSSAACLQAGVSLIIFPEGTRTRVGEELQFQRGAAHIALQAGVAPTPVIIRCNPPTLSKQHKWYDIPARKFRISINVQPDLPISEFSECQPSLGARRLSKHLQDYFTGELRQYEFDRT